jgi:hypothetical protein
MANTIRALFFGNSYTFRNDLPEVVKQLAEAGDPELTFEYTKVVYGGRTLENHWEQFQSQNILRLPNLTQADLEQVCQDLEAGAKKAETLPEPESKDTGRYRSAVANHRDWMSQLGADAPGWDYVVLQSWRDTEGGVYSGYAIYATMFAELVRARGAKVILYNTGPIFQNAEPLIAAPDNEAALEETRFVAALGSLLAALVVPVPLAIVKCQAERPDVVLRYINDGHPNQVCGYLTACLFYAALFGQSPEGLSVDRVIDPKVVDKNKPDVGPDGDPRECVFSDGMRALLQKIAWETILDFGAMNRDA